MTQYLSMMTKAVLGLGAVLEDKNPIPIEHRVVQGAKSTAPVEAKTPINSQDDNTPSLSP